MQEGAHVRLNNAMNLLELSFGYFYQYDAIYLFEQKEPGCVNSR
jgi:hypothetical protein